MSSEYLGVHQAAERLGVAPITIYRRIWSGALPAVRIGRVLRVRWADLVGDDR